MLRRSVFANFAIVPQFFLVLCLSLHGSIARPDATDCPIKFAKLITRFNQTLKKIRTEFEFAGEHFEFDRPIPFQMGEGANRQEMSVQFRKISDMDKKMRDQMIKLKAQARTGTPREREVGQIFVEYSHGPSRSAEFTSRDRDRISIEAAYKAYENSGVFDTTMTSVTHAHTHPRGTQRASVLFSEADILHIQALKQDIEEQLGHPIKFRGILVPNCSTCDDVVLVIDL